MRLVNADVLPVELITARRRVFKDGRLRKIDCAIFAVTQENILKAPTIDAVEVIRCFDCIHGGTLRPGVKESGKMICTNKNMFLMRTSPDFYCAYGKRKMDAPEGE